MNNHNPLSLMLICTVIASVSFVYLLGSVDIPFQTKDVLFLGCFRPYEVMQCFFPGFYASLSSATVSVV
jgi:hypothetical protein